MQADGEERASLTARGVTVSYGKRPAVEDASLTLAAGCVTALLGPNGSGKSTLLRAMARLHPPVAGAVELEDGTDALALSRAAFARRVTLLAQQRPVPAGLSVHDVVGFGRHPHRSRLGRDPEGPAAIERALTLTGTASLASRAIDGLSGGQLQRVWIAACLAQRTDVLLLDEPTTYLDLRYQVEILDLVRALADDHGVAIGVVLHDLDQAAAVADRVVLLDGGRVVADGDPRSVYDPELLSRVYGIRIEVDDGVALRTRALGAHSRRALAADHHQ